MESTEPWNFDEEFTPEDFLEVVENLEYTHEEERKFYQAPKLTKLEKQELQKQKEKTKVDTLAALREEISSLRKEIEIRDAQLQTMYYHLLNIIKKHLYIFYILSKHGVFYFLFAFFHTLYFVQTEEHDEVFFLCDEEAEPLLAQPQELY